eukprot:3078986-Rhodomonas_salina.3
MHVDEQTCWSRMRCSRTRRAQSPRGCPTAAQSRAPHPTAPTAKCRSSHARPSPCRLLPTPTSPADARSQCARHKQNSWQRIWASGPELLRPRKCRRRLRSASPTATAAARPPAPTRRRLSALGGTAALTRVEPERLVVWGERHLPLSYPGAESRRAIPRELQWTRAWQSRAGGPGAG